MRRVLFVALALLSSSALAEDGITLVIENRSSEPVVRLNTFPINAEGEPVEDNLGGIMEDIPAGATGTLELSLLRCGRVHVALGLGAGAAERQLTAAIDTCTSRTLVVTD